MRLVVTGPSVSPRSSRNAASRPRVSDVQSQELTSYRPVKRGSRFSWNAANASGMSSVCAMSA